MTDVDNKTAKAAADRLNRDCFCITLDRGSLHAALRAETHEAQFEDTYLAARPHLFSNSPVFLSRGEIAAMAEIVEAIEAAARLPAYQAAALAAAPEIARHDFGPAGVLMGYDFHVGADGPKLIEVNTNAGGAFLNAALAKAQHVCCAEVGLGLGGSLASDFDDAAWRMFLTEWERQGRSEAPAVVAIVDDAPQEQYLFPEFLLARSFFERHGAKAIIVDAQSLSFTNGRLSHKGQPIDLVYNRLVDFALAEPGHEALRLAYEAGAAVVTPNPRNHALHADKRNLIALSDQRTLTAWGLEERHRRVLAAGVPHSTMVTPENADLLWSRRKSLFFKPRGGHAGKAVYRGDKLTKGVWAEIAAGGYIAQDLAPPSERMIAHDGEPRANKLDVRLYTYQGEVLMTAARVYQGQTTNFRTPGGGFAPVLAL